MRRVDLAVRDRSVEGTVAGHFRGRVFWESRPAESYREDKGVTNP